jgi:UDP-glucose 4-epimerase
MENKTVLVCGGAGYIGSHLVKELGLCSYKVVVFDNFSTGHSSAVASVIVERGDIRDSLKLEMIFNKYNPFAVFHLCASIVVSESCRDPLGYYENNVSGTINLLQTMKKFNVKYFIFSSTAALFGIPEKIPIQSDDKTAPINPYGESKLMVENILRWCDEAYGMKYVCLRYFNACGADSCGDIGEDHTPETHLIPLVLQVPLGKRQYVTIYGTDYETPDGTCIRDYIHVSDLADAHIKALEYLLSRNSSNNFNLGCGKGFSVLEIIQSAERVTNKKIAVKNESRREGDAAVLIADSEKAETLLGWKRKYQKIDEIVLSAWNFHQRHANGMEGK